VDDALEGLTEWARVSAMPSPGPVPVVRFVTARGGLARRAELTPQFTGRQIAAAVGSGLLVRDAPGHYALPTADAARRAVRRVNGVAVGRSAAAMWRLPLKTQPTRPEVAVPRGRRVRPEDQHVCQVHWRTLEPEDVHRGEVTTPLRTVVDCARTLPFDEALAVADSALRSGRVGRDQLVAAAQAVPRSGRAAALRVAREADGRAANPFESVLRAISLDVPGLRLVPQAPVVSAGRVIHPDLSDASLRIVVEGDSHEFHTNRRQIDIDCERYDELTLDGWLVLRFSHHQAMARQDWVRATMARATASRMTTTIPGLAPGPAPPRRTG
jgi:very-short-patch-repair endonuclease